MYVCVCVEYCRMYFAACCHSKPWAISDALLNSLRNDGRWCREKSSRGVAWHEACFTVLTVTWLFECRSIVANGIERYDALARKYINQIQDYYNQAEMPQRLKMWVARCWKSHPAGCHRAGRLRNDMPRLQAPQILMCNSPCPGTHLVRVWV